MNETESMPPATPTARKRFEHPFHGARPKISERMPDPPTPARGSAFEIDENKFRSAMPPPTSTPADDFKVLSAIGCVGVAVIAALVLVVNIFFRFLPDWGVLVAALIVGVAWLAQRWILPDDPTRSRGSRRELF